MSWKQLLSHPFWEKRLEHLIPPTMSRKSIMIDGKENLDELDQEELEENEDRVNTMNFSRMSTDRPRTAGASLILDKHPEVNVSFSIR